MMEHLSTLFYRLLDSICILEEFIYLFLNLIVNSLFMEFMHDTCICYAQSVHGFTQSRDCLVQSLDPWLVVQTMDWPRDPGIDCAQSINQDNPGIARVFSHFSAC